MLKGLIGKKIGMTQIFDEDGAAVPITLIEAGPCYVTQVRTQQNDAYSAVQLGFDEIKPAQNRTCLGDFLGGCSGIVVLCLLIGSGHDSDL